MIHTRPRIIVHVHLTLRISQSHSKIYSALCLALSDHLDQACTDLQLAACRSVDWASFSPAEWEALPYLAQAEGVAPLLYARLKGASCRSQIPEPVMTALAAEYYRSAAQNTLLFSELDRILAALNEAQIQVIVLKGAAMAQTVYPDPALRPMSDLDLLVQPHNVGRALQVLQGCGYALEKITYHAMLQGGPNQAVTIELHWTLPDVSPAVSGAFLDRIFSLPESDPQRATFEFLYLCAHLMLQHAADSPRLIWFYDLHLLVEQARSTAVATPRVEQVHSAATETPRVEQARSAAVETLAATLGWQTALAAALDGLTSRLGNPLPPNLQNLAASFPADSLPAQQRRIRRWMVAAFKALPFAARLRMTAGFFFPSPAYLRWRYQPKPRWLWPLYYPRRWGEMVLDGLRLK